jgi:hypothetical protein
LSGLWLDRALCVLLALLSASGLIYGLMAERPAVAGAGCFALAGAAWAAQVLFDREALRRSRGFGRREGERGADAHAVLDVLLAQRAQGRVAQRRRHQLPGKGHVLRRLLGGEAQARVLGQANQQVARDEPADQQGAHRGGRLLDALALLGRELFDLGDRQPELRADLRHQPREQRRVRCPVDTGQRHGAGRGRHQRLAADQPAAAMDCGNELFIAPGKFDG